MAIDDQTAERQWLLDAYRGEITTDDALRAVQNAHRPDAQLDDDAHAALAEGDKRHPDDVRRWPDDPAPWKPDIDIDPAATAAFEQRSRAWASTVHERDKLADEVLYLKLDLQSAQTDLAVGRVLDRIADLPEQDQDLAYHAAKLDVRNADLEAEIDVLCGNGRTAAADLDENDGPLTPAEKIRFALLTSANLRALPPPEPLVDGLIYRNAHTMLYAAAGAGKSFLAIDIALHVITGRPWQGRPVAAGPVLYIVGEGVSGTGQRLDAWDTHHDHPTPEHSIYWHPRAVNLPDPAWAGALADVVAGLQPALVVIDTYARCTAGADENSAKDTGIIVAHLDQIRTAAGSAVLIVHHSGKDTTNGARGSSALRAAVDTELQLEGDRHNLVLHTRKQKDAPEADPIHLALTPVDGTDSAVITASARSMEPAWDGPTNCMDAIVAYFRERPELELSTRRCVEDMRAHWQATNRPSYHQGTVAESLERLADQGVLRRAKGQRNANLFSLHPDHAERDHEQF